MSWLWLRIAKYKVLVKNAEWDSYKPWYTEYPITEDEYSRLKIAIEHKEPFTWIHDLDGNKVIEINAKRDIKKFIPIIHKQSAWKVQNICHFWVRHDRLPEWGYNCDCEKEFWCRDFQFKDKLREVLWFEFTHKSEITDKIRYKYKQLINNN